MRNDLEALISSIDMDKAVVQVFTNGLRLDSQRAASLKAHDVYGVQISLDSPNRAEHDRLRGVEGAFRAVERGVKSALEAGLLVGISTYATRESVLHKSLSGIAGLAAAWGAHEVSVFDVIPTGKWLRRDDLILDEESRRDLMKEAKRLNKKYQGRTRVVTQSWTNSGVGFAKSFGCLAGNYQFHVTPYGDFTPCDFTPLSFGNARTAPIGQLWKTVAKHPAYCRHADKCRMQSMSFRKQYIHRIPEGATLPICINDLVPEEDDEMRPAQSAVSSLEA